MMLLSKTKNKNKENTAPNKLPPIPPPPKNKYGIHITAMLGGFTDSSTSVLNIGDIGASKVHLEIINNWKKKLEFIDN